MKMKQWLTTLWQWIRTEKVCCWCERKHWIGGNPLGWVKSHGLCQAQLERQIFLHRSRISPAPAKKQHAALPSSPMRLALFLAICMAAFNADAAGLQRGSHVWYYSATTIVVCLAIAAVLLVVWLAQRAGLMTLLMVLGVVLLCLVGAFAAIVGWQRLDRWCQRQLSDTDGQEERV